MKWRCAQFYQFTARDSLGGTFTNSRLSSTCQLLSTRCHPFHQQDRGSHQISSGRIHALIPVNFDSSWKTRGFYSNLGFGSAISALTKKVLDYELLNHICELCNRWSAKRRQEHPDEYQNWYDSHKASKVNHTGSSQSMEPAAAKLI